jgi:hypothetical protein
MEAFWDVMPCSLLEVDQRFIGACWLHHQLKRWPTFTSLHGTVAQKAVIFSIVSLHHDCMNLLFIDKRDIEFHSSVLTLLYGISGSRGGTMKMRAFWDISLCSLVEVD